MTLDPISRIARDTAVPREVLVRVIGAAVTEHRVIVSDDEPEPTPAHGELVSMSEASRRFGVNLVTVYGWVKQGRLRDYGAEEQRPGSPRLVDVDEVAALAVLPRRLGGRPRKPKGPAYVRELEPAR